ncbi:uncharacterized protein [Panulirus ornatus]|uniref:uncharacterized protein isoform X1 n=2 Tax=Panulirus ornatus TaxID=150431 RepID=UPI003A867FA2
MRVTFALVVSLAALCSAQSQRRPPSILQQAMITFVENMGNMASRIGTGMMRTLGGSGNTNSIRNAPPRQRQRLTNPQASIPARQIDDNSLPAPNAPQQSPARPGLRQNRNRLSFRQIVDGAVSRIMNLMPRLRRRFSRQRNTRDVQHQ